MKYADWIKEHGTSEKLCAEKTLEMQAVFPELRRVRGWYSGEPHWWLVDPSGNIVDPTREQFSYEGTYVERDESEPEPTGKCFECGSYCYDGADFCCASCRVSYYALFSDTRRI